MPRVLVLHGGYGCETGCCGHWVEIDGKRVGSFDFGHPYGHGDEEMRDYVRRLVTAECGEAHVANIDWDNCIVCDD